MYVLCCVYVFMKRKRKEKEKEKRELKGYFVNLICESPYVVKKK